MNLAYLFAAVASLTLAVVVADDAPPAETSAQKVVADLEGQGYDPVVDVSFDDGGWEVEAYKGDDAVELTLPADGARVLSEHRDDAEARPPKDSLKLAKILALVSDAGFDRVDEASFERRYWEVEARRGSDRFELHLDPASGKIVTERADD
jgi:uncharacterized membrane protein YkoI